MNRREQRAPLVGVIQLPGVNCEYETLDAVRRAGMQAVLVRWNAGRDLIASLDGYVLPGGFSFQDRVRSGAVAAKETVIEYVSEEASRGKPVLGICNGAQVLVEAGLVPGLRRGQVDMGLAPNVMDGRTGHLCRWVYIKACHRSGGSAFTEAFTPGEVIPIPVSHSEGRFVSSEESILKDIDSAGQITFRYCGETGVHGGRFPENPNGSWMDAAGVCNPEGNVMALMPHPERAAWIGQVSVTVPGYWAQRKRAAWGDRRAMEAPGPGLKVFESMAAYIIRGRAH